MAQLGARPDGIGKVVGSNPISSTISSEDHCFHRLRSQQSSSLSPALLGDLVLSEGQVQRLILSVAFCHAVIYNVSLPDSRITDYFWQMSEPRRQPLLHLEAMAVADVAECLAEIGRQFYARGWVLGTSGNFSAVVSRTPLRLLITPSGVDKGVLTADQMVEVTADGKAIKGLGRPSAEAILHLTLVRLRGAGVVLHTHSVWSTMVSEVHASQAGLWIQGYEMLKGLAGVQTHAHREWLPILENCQDYQELSRGIEETFVRYPNTHGFLLRRHGLYTWGEDVEQAKRHVEILEFLLEVLGRMYCAEAPDLSARTLGILGHSDAAREGKDYGYC